jgi:hypothetical protein
VTSRDAVGHQLTLLFVFRQMDKVELRIAEQQGVSREKLLEAIMSLAQQRAQILVGQEVMPPEDVERFLHHFLKRVEEHLKEVWSHHDELHEALTLTPEDVATVLGISVPEFMAHFENHGTLEQLAIRQGTKLEELVARILDEAQASLNRLVEEGKISSTEAGEILADLKRASWKLLMTPTNITPSYLSSGSPYRCLSWRSSPSTLRKCPARWARRPTSSTLRWPRGRCWKRWQQ